MSSSHFQFKEHDAEGLETLQAIKEADAFNLWMYQQIAPFIKSPVLEIGSGIGNISECCMREGHDLIMTDIREEYLQFLKGRFPDVGHQIIQLDLVDVAFDERYKQYEGKFNTVFALNVIEHIEEDDKAIKNAIKLLAPGGILIILVPAHPLLYNKIDRHLFHFKRYTKSELKRLMQLNQLQLKTIQGFNALGIMAWVYGGHVARKGVIGGNDMKLYNKLVPIAKFLDKLFLRKLGLSLIAISHKKPN